MSKKKWGQVRGFSKNSERQSENTGSTPDCCRRKRSQKQPQPAQTIVFSSVGWIYLHLSMVVLSQAREAELPSVAFVCCNQLNQVLGKKEVYFRCFVNASPELNACLHKTWAPASTCTALPSWILRFSSNLKLIHSPKVQVLTTFVVVSSEKEIDISIWIKQNHIYTNF